MIINTRVPISLCIFLAVFSLGKQGFAFPAKVGELHQGILLTDALNALSVRFQVFFTYDSDLLRNIEVDFDVAKYESLEDAVTELLNESGLKYDLIGARNCVIYRDTKAGIRSKRKIERKMQQIAALEKKGHLSLQQSVNSDGSKVPIKALTRALTTLNALYPITGQVVDESGESLIGVNVFVKGTSTGTVTDLEGSFSIDVPQGESVLVFSYTGFESQEVVVDDKAVLQIILTEAISDLDEVVVIGYGTQQKSDLTGAVTRADIESFRESPNVNLVQSLQGTVPGLNIGQVDAAGANPSISVRGNTTINGNQNVLIVVDGIVFSGSMNELNPNDIESVDVLKDPSSMAIFGAQAANGVILIKTREGKASEKPIFNYTGSFTTQSPSNELTGFDRAGFERKSFDIDWENSFIAPEYTQLKPNWTYLDVVQEPELRGGFENGTDYDWWENATNPSHINAHNLSVRGSEGNVSYYMSGGYTDQKGYILNDEFQRTTVRINLENKILEWFKIGAQTFGSFSDYSGDSPTLGNIIRMPPLVAPIDENGEFIFNPTGANTLNPFLVAQSDDFDKRNSLFGNFFLDVDVPFIEGLNYRLNFGNNYRWNRKYSSNEYANSAAGNAFKSNSSWYDWTLDNILSYRRTFATVHSLDVTLVYGRRESSFEQGVADAANFNNLRLGYNNLNLGGIQRIESSAWDESYLYQMGRINYKYNYKYLFTATVRRDGFSGFARNKKTALFPSVGLGWVVSEEDFLNADWINNLKLRFSYGTNGNLVGRYSSLARLSSFPAYVFGDGGSTIFGQEIQNLANPNLSWETTTGSNFGLDFGILGNRVTASLDYYRTTTSDLIFNVSIPQITGFNEITTNVGEIANRGVELNLNASVLKKEDFEWNVNLNLASNKNEIISLIDLDADDDGTEDDLVASGLFLGQSINSVYSYESAGIIQLGEEVPLGYFVGTHRIVDQNGDGAITPNDRVILGREEPAFRFGVMNEVSYQNFTLRVFINSIQGGKDGYLGRNILDGFGSGDNIRRNNFWSQVDYWTPANPDAKYRRLDQEPAIDYVFFGDRSFVRLQDVTLAYRFPKVLLNKIGFEGLKFFVSGKNLATWTTWEGWDPETGDGFEPDGRPVLKGLSIGLDATF